MQPGSCAAFLAGPVAAVAYARARSPAPGPPGQTLVAQRIEGPRRHDCASANICRPDACLPCARRSGGPSCRSRRTGIRSSSRRADLGGLISHTAPPEEDVVNRADSGPRGVPRQRAFDRVLSGSVAVAARRITDSAAITSRARRSRQNRGRRGHVPAERAARHIFTMWTAVNMWIARAPGCPPPLTSRVITIECGHAPP